MYPGASDWLQPLLLLYIIFRLYKKPILPELNTQSAIACEFSNGRMKWKYEISDWFIFIMHVIAFLQYIYVFSTNRTNIGTNSLCSNEKLNLFLFFRYVHCTSLPANCIPGHFSTGTQHSRHYLKISYILTRRNYLTTAYGFTCILVYQIYGNQSNFQDSSKLLF